MIDVEMEQFHSIDRSTSSLHNSKHPNLMFYTVDLDVMACPKVSIQVLLLHQQVVLIVWILPVSWEDDTRPLLQSSVGTWQITDRT